jgi:hypothetical protein
MDRVAQICPHFFSSRDSVLLTASGRSNSNPFKPVPLSSCYSRQPAGQRPAKQRPGICHHTTSGFGGEISHCELVGRIQATPWKGAYAKRLWSGARTLLVDPFRSSSARRKAPGLGVGISSPPEPCWRSNHAAGRTACGVTDVCLLL